MARFRLSETPFDTATLRAELLDARVGGYASFEGWVRDHNDGRAVHGLRYEAYAALAQREGGRREAAWRGERAMIRLKLLYFASLRDAAGVPDEEFDTEAADLAALYDGLRARHGFALPRERLRVAMDGAFCSWDAPVREGAEIAFIPPVSGG